MMLSPEAELDIIVRTLSESSDPNSPTHLSKREARRLVSQAVRASLAIQGIEPAQCLRFFLLDLDRTSIPIRSGI